MNEKYKTLFSNTVIFAIGNILTKVIQFFLMPIYTIAMTTSEFGTAEVINNLSDLVLPLATLCLYESIFRFSIDEDADYTAILSASVSIVLKCLLLISLLAGIINFFFEIPYVGMFLFLLLSASLKMIFAQFSRGIGLIKVFSISGILNALLLCVINYIMLVLYKMGTEGFLWSLIISNILTVVYLVSASNALNYIHFRKFDKSAIKKLLTYSLPLIPNALSWWFVNISSRYVIVLFKGVAIAGLYSAASKLPTLINLFTTIFQQAWQYSSAKEIDKNGATNFFSNVFKYYSGFILVMCSTLIAITPFISKFILLGSFYEAWKFVPLLIVSAVLNCYSVFFGSFYTATKKSSMIMISTFCGGLLNILISLYFVPKIGVWGALFASVICYLTITIIRIVNTQKIIKVEINWPYLVISFILLVLQAIALSIQKKGLISNTIYCGLIVVTIYTYRKSISKILKNRKIS